MVQKNQRGVETNKHTTFAVKIDDLTFKQTRKVMQHYGFKTQTEMFHALIRREAMRIDLK